MIEELEKEFLKEGEEEQKKETTGLKFLDNALERKKSMIKNEAVKLLGQLKGSKDLE